MGRVFFDEAGKPSSLPTSLEDAKRLHWHNYNAGYTCPDCNHSTARYTANGECCHCALLAALDLYALCVGGMKFCPLPSGWSTTYERIDVVDSSRDISEEYYSRLVAARALFSDPAPTTRQDAVEVGSTLWVSSQPCKKHGHFGVLTIKGECRYCVDLRDTPSPRQTALSSGSIWYTPSTPCPKCETTADRRVSNGECSGCTTTGTTDGRSTTDADLMRDSPDLVIGKVDAVAYGLKVYRTGNACKRGHEGFRYVSTGNCIECLRGDKTNG